MKNGGTDVNRGALFFVPSLSKEVLLNHRKKFKASKIKYLSLIVSLKYEMYWNKVSLRSSLCQLGVPLCSAASNPCSPAQKASLSMVTERVKKKSFMFLPVYHKFLLPITAKSGFEGKCSICQLKQGCVSMMLMYHHHHHRHQPQKLFAKCFDFWWNCIFSEIHWCCFNIKLF